MKKRNLTIMIISIFLFLSCGEPDPVIDSEINEDDSAHVSQQDKEIPDEANDNIVDAITEKEEIIDNDISESVCGNGVLESDEMCEPGTQWGCKNFPGEGYIDGVAECLPDCSDFDRSTCIKPECGNGKKEPGEACDRASIDCTTLDKNIYASGKATCADDCSGYNTESCELVPVCGNETVEKPAETCEKEEQKNCAELSDNFKAGTAICKDDCSDWNTENCEAATTDPFCGDKIINNNEVCDGNMVCSEIKGETFTSGTAVCNSDCSDYDTSGCAQCGNSVKESGEVCDGEKAVACSDVSAAYISGTADCLDKCSGYDTSACVTGEAILIETDSTTLTYEFIPYTDDEPLFANAISVTDNNIYISGATHGDMFGENPSNGIDPIAGKYSLAGVEERGWQFGSYGDDLVTVSLLNDANELFAIGRTAGTMGAVNYGLEDLFITKIGTNGQIAWTKQWGYTDDGVFLLRNDVPRAATFDSDGNLFVTGGEPGGGPGFIAKFDKDGELLWYEYVEGEGHGIVIDSTGKIWISGQVIFDTFIAGFTDETTYGSQDDYKVWVADTNPNNPDPTDVTTYARGMAIGADDTIYISGATYGNWMGNQNLGAEANLFVFKVKPSEIEQDMLPARQFGTGGGFRDIVLDMEIGTDGSLYIAGYTDGNMSLNEYSNQGNEDLYITKLSPNFETQWIILGGTEKLDTINDLTLFNGTVYATGSFDMQVVGHDPDNSSNAFLLIISE